MPLVCAAVGTAARRRPLSARLLAMPSGAARASCRSEAAGAIPTVARNGQSRSGYKLALTGLGLVDCARVWVVSD